MAARLLAPILLLLLVSVTVPAWTDAPADAASIPLVNQHGEPFQLQQLQGKLVLLSFGYTYCPDICPTELAALSRVLDALGERAHQVQGLFISLDPQRDTPGVLKSYLAYFHPDLLGLTGSPEAIKQVAGHFRVRYRRHRQPGGGYSLDHSANLYIVDRRGRLSTIVPYGLPPEHVLRVVNGMLQPTQQD